MKRFPPPPVSLWELLVLEVGLPGYDLCYVLSMRARFQAFLGPTLLGEEGATMYELALKFVEELVLKKSPRTLF